MALERPVRSRQEWAAAVKARDNSTCQKCGAVEDLHAHHIKHRSTHPELTLDLKNGLTLCRACHAAEHAELSFLFDGSARSRTPAKPRKRRPRKEDPVQDNGTPFSRWCAILNLSIVEAAEALDISVDTAKAYSNGKAKLRIPTRYAMSAIYHQLPCWGSDEADIKPPC